MGQPLKAITATGLTVAGVAGCVVLLAGQGLDRAEKWVSIVGMLVSVAIGACGLVLGWATWRQAPGSEEGTHVWVRRTGNATASGPGSRANTGLAAPTTGPVIVERTGNAHADDGGWANTGQEQTR